MKLFVTTLLMAGLASSTPLSAQLTKRQYGAWELRKQVDLITDSVGAVGIQSTSTSGSRSLVIFACEHDGVFVALQMLAAVEDPVVYVRVDERAPLGPYTWRNSTDADRTNLVGPREDALEILEAARPGRNLVVQLRASAADSIRRTAVFDLEGISAALSRYDCAL